MPTVQLKHSFGEPTLMGARGAPKGRPKPTWAPTRLSPKCAPCMVSINSSRCILFICSILLENRPSWARGAPKCPPGGAPKSKFIESRQVWCLSLRIDAYCSAETFVWRTDPHGARGSRQRVPQRAPHPTSTEIHLNQSPMNAGHNEHLGL